MTAPAESTTPQVDPAATVDTTTPEPVDSVRTDEQQAPKTGLPDDPAALRNEIERLRRENASARTTAKKNAADEARNELAQQIGKALGLVKDDEPADPAKLTEQLTAQTSAARQAQVELAIFRAASAAGADANALLDSRSFMAGLGTVDPSDSAAVSAAITAAVEQNPALSTKPAMRPNPMQGSSSSGAAAPVFTRAQLSDPSFFQQNRAEIMLAMREGRIQS